MQRVREKGSPAHNWMSLSLTRNGKFTILHITKKDSYRLILLLLFNFKPVPPPFETVLFRMHLLGPQFGLSVTIDAFHS